LKTEFWLIVSLLLCLALLIIIPPLLRKKKIKTFDIDQQNIEIAQQKQAELKELLANNAIAQDEFDTQLNELELTLVDDLSLTDTTVARPQQHNRSIIFAILVFIPIASISLYLTLGNPDALLKTTPSPIVAKNTAHKKQINSVDTLLSGLVNRLKKHPDDLSGWLLLGKSYSYLGRPNLAVDAYEKAYKLSGDTPKVILQYASALLANNKNKFNDNSKALVLKALELFPNNGDALWLAGLLKDQQQDHSSAMTYWQQAEQTMDPKSEHYKALKLMLTNTENAENAEIPENRATSNIITTSQSITPVLAEKTSLPSNDQQKLIEMGRSYKSKKQYQQAIDAFSKADIINSNQAPAMLLYADSLVMKNKSHFSELAKSLIFKALSISPNNTTGLWLAGKAKVQDGSFDEALSYLYRAKSTLSPESGSYAILDSYIAKVITHSTNTKNPQTIINQPPLQEKISLDSNVKTITVAVSLSKSLINSVNPEETLFIYANALSGPQMPVAIARKKVKDLPLQIQLTDELAMTPAMKLSKFQQVSVTARISKSGNALRQAGDLLGKVDTVKVGESKTIQITIDQII